VIDDVEARRAEERARELIVWCDALTDAGLDETARRARMVARDSVELADTLDAERSARRALQERCERLQAIIGRQADATLRRLAK
jgi:hypothetical protein